MMNKMFVRRLTALWLVLMIALCPSAFGVTSVADSAEGEAKAIAASSVKGLDSTSNAFSESYKTHATARGTVELTFDTPVSVLYLIYVDAPGEWTLRVGEREFVCGRNGFLEEYVDLRELCGVPSFSTLSLSLTYQSNVGIVRLCAFGGEGRLPSFVHRWDTPCTKADLLLFTSHADDEQLFFAGTLPFYSMVRGCEVQVAYATDHSNAKYRRYELLEGLWEVGIRHYPVISEFPDYYSESRDAALSKLKSVGFPQETVMAWFEDVVERFRPQVIVSHDEKGEYGHGMHMLTSYCVRQTVDKLAPSIPELKKVYLHLYQKDPITLTVIDQPSEALGGKTPFQITQDGFQWHQSQHYTWFFDWLYYGAKGASKKAVISSASQIKSYSPLSFGLYYSSVAPDEEKNDFFEHLTTYAEQYAEEERIRVEEESRAAEAEESRRLEEESRAKLAAEEESRRIAESESVSLAESEQASRDAATEPTDISRAGSIPPVVWIILLAAIVCVCIALILFQKKSRDSRRGRRRLGRK